MVWNNIRILAVFTKVVERNDVRVALFVGSNPSNFLTLMKKWLRRLSSSFGGMYSPWLGILLLFHTISGIKSSAHFLFSLQCFWNLRVCEDKNRFDQYVEWTNQRKVSLRVSRNSKDSTNLRDSKSFLFSFFYTFWGRWIINNLLDSLMWNMAGYFTRQLVFWLA